MFEKLTPDEKYLKAKTLAKVVIDEVRETDCEGMDAMIILSSAAAMVYAASEALNNEIFKLPKKQYRDTWLSYVDDLVKSTEAKTNAN